ncbi:TPA: IS4 family transposase, partial [Enterococcus faecium]
LYLKLCNRTIQTNFAKETNLLTKNSLFKRLRIIDSTAFILDPIFAKDFSGSGGTRHTSGAKIQLEYDLFSGRIIENYLGAEKEGDKHFSNTYLSPILPGDLCIRDLGYFDLKEYQAIQDAQGFYITRVKTTTRLFLKNTHPESFKNNNGYKKHSLYLPISLEELADTLQSGETIEFPEVYCGKGHYLGARVIVHCLTAKERKNREQQIAKLAQKRKPLSERSKKIKKLNIYLTNCPVDHVPMDMVHELYSLRWQIELLFKTWKSVFKINRVKKINVYRLKCHIYSKLIALWLTMTTMYKMRKLLYEKQDK